jgi:hypothetical protein
MAAEKWAATELPGGRSCGMVRSGAQKILASQQLLLDRLDEARAAS